MHTDIRVKRVKYANYHIIWTPSEETKEMVWQLVKIGTVVCSKFSPEKSQTILIGTNDQSLPLKNA